MLQFKRLMIYNILYLGGRYYDKRQKYILKNL